MSHHFTLQMNAARPEQVYFKITKFKYYTISRQIFENLSFTKLLNKFLFFVFRIFVLYFFIVPGECGFTDRSINPIKKLVKITKL
jgi:hypothetical protein